MSLKVRVGPLLTALVIFLSFFLTFLPSMTVEAAGHQYGLETGKMYDIDNPLDGYPGKTVWLTHHKKKASSISWDVVDYVVTAGPVSGNGYNVPQGSPRVGDYIHKDYEGDCPGSGSKYTDIIRYVENNDIIKLCMRAGVTPDADGVYTAYLQPVIRVFYEGVPKKGPYFSLNDWKNAEPWADTSTFESVYDKRIRVSRNDASNLKIYYKTLSDGNGYSADTPITGTGLRSVAPNIVNDVKAHVVKGNWGEIFSYRSNNGGMLSVINGEAIVDGQAVTGNRTWVLTGIEVTGTGEGYTGGRIECSTDENNRVTIGESYNLKQNTLNTHHDVSSDGYQFDRTSSTLYNVSYNKDFRSHLGTTEVTYYYSELKTEVRVDTVAYYEGLNEIDALPKSGVYQAGESIIVAPHVVPLSLDKNGYKWELTEAKLWKSASNLSTMPVMGFHNVAWGNSSSHAFPWNASSSAYQQDANNFNRLHTSSYLDLTYMGVYKVLPPQVELYYYKDALGSYHLFNMTTGNRPWGSDVKRNEWNSGDTEHSVHVLQKPYNAYDGTVIDKDLILTQSGVYEGAARGSLAGYNGTTNCWSYNSLPTGGGWVNGTVFTTDAQTAYDEASRNNQWQRRTVFNPGPGPSFLVYVYEGGPKVTTLSLYKNGTGDGMLYTRSALTDRQFAIGGRTMQCGNVVEYPLGTTSVSYDDVYLQDGVDQDRNDQITINGLTLFHTKDFITNDLGTVGTIKGFVGRPSISEAEVNAWCTTWTTTKSHHIDFRNGEAAMIKVFDPNPPNGFWTVGYANLENTKDDATSVYSRLQEPRMAAITMQTSVSFASPFGNCLRLEDKANKVHDSWTLTNVGVSTYQHEYVGLKPSGGFFTHPDASDYAPASITGLEVNDSGKGIAWLDSDRPKYNYRGFGPLSGYASEKINAVKQDISANGANTWLWGVYRADKAVNTVHAIENPDGSYRFIDSVTSQDLSPYTKEFTVSMEPYLFVNGKVYRLVEMRSDLFRDKTRATPDSLDDWQRKQAIEYNGSVPKNNVMRDLDVYRKDLYVCGIYEEFGSGGREEETVTTESIVSFRDTVNGAVSSGSWNELPDGMTSDAVFRGVIDNDNELSSDGYTAEHGIPTTEFVSSYAYTPKYLVDLDFLRTDYSKNYGVVCYAGLNVVSKETDKYGNTVTMYSGEILQESITVNRKGRNFVLSGANVWTPTDVTLGNYALPNRLGQSVTMKRTGLYDSEKPRVVRGKSAEISIPEYAPEYLQLNYGVTYVNGGNTSLGKVDEIRKEWNGDHQRRVADSEGIVAQMRMANEEVTFYDGNHREQLMVNYGLDLVVRDPKDVQYAGVTSKTVFNSKNNNVMTLGKDDDGNFVQQEDTTSMQIDALKSNGVKESTGAVHYECTPADSGVVVYADGYFEGNAEDAVSSGVSFVMNTNSVKIHTPVVVNLSISNDEENSQIIGPGIGQDMILDKPFTLTVSATGYHNGNPGYGNKDYSRYFETKGGNPVVQVKFPFPVIAPGSVWNGTKDVYYEPNVWISVELGNTEFFLPSWADEGESQLIRVRANAVNARENDPGLVKAEQGANYHESNYLTFEQNLIEVVGRIYGLGIIDIGDYPLWEDYFRTDGVLNGNRYYSGLTNQNGFKLGITPQLTFPTIAGSNQKYVNAGVLKPGYVVKYQLETVGNLFSADDFVKIAPEFYYVSKEDGSRKRVDVYYNETIAGNLEQYVRIGSEKDRMNAKYYSLNSGDFGIDGVHVKETSDLLGYDSISKFADKETPVYSFGNIMLNQYTRIFSGKDHESILSNGKTINWWEAGMRELAEDSPVLNKRITTSVQNWYGQYYLPATIYVTDLDEDTVKDKMAAGESPWLSNGYLVVNFNVIAVDGGEMHLAYDAPRVNDLLAAEAGDDQESEFSVRFAGRCNMWDVENFLNTKTDADGRDFAFSDGDFIVLDLDAGSVMDDHTSGGTH